MMDLDVLLYSLRAAFPQAAIPGPLRLLGEGFFSTAVQTADGMVFRIGRTARAAHGYAREAALLPALDGLLPVEIPRPRLYMPAGGEVFPYGVMAYPGLPGEELQPERMSGGDLETVARQVAGLILALQRIPLRRLGLADDSAGRRAVWERRRDITLPALRQVFSSTEYNALVGWWEAVLAGDAMSAYSPVFQHGDLWGGNLLSDGARITAVLDWSEAGAGDPAQDFVPQFYPGEAFFNLVLDSAGREGWRADGGFWRRLANLRLLREMDGLEYAVLLEDGDEWDDAVEKVKKVFSWFQNSPGLF